MGAILGARVLGEADCMRGIALFNRGIQAPWTINDPPRQGAAPPSPGPSGPARHRPLDPQYRKTGPRPGLAKPGTQPQKPLGGNSNPPLQRDAIPPWHQAQPPRVGKKLGLDRSPFWTIRFKGRK